MAKFMCGGPVVGRGGAGPRVMSFHGTPSLCEIIKGKPVSCAPQINDFILH